MSGDAFLGLRKEYSSLKLDESDLNPDPLLMLRQWIEAAKRSGHPEPSAMCLGTVGVNGQPSGRMLLLRDLDSGLVFYTNYESQKGTELSKNPLACATFWWPEMERQIRVEGHVSKLTPQESDAYFQGRPYESRIASAASPQSQPIENRNEIEKAIEAKREALPNYVKRPEHWGGYRLTPSRFEFWQGRPARVHDRFEYLRQDGNWQIRRLAP